MKFLNEILMYKALTQQPMLGSVLNRNSNYRKANNVLT